MIHQLRGLRLAFRLWRARRLGVQIGRGCILIGTPLWGSEPYLVSLGNRVRIGSGVTFITHDGGTWIFRDSDRYRNVIKFGRITVHDNTFIGYGVTLLPGVEIGPNSVVGACSLVTRSVPANTVVGGNPAREITTTAEYAEKALRQCPDYDPKRYRANRKAELLKIFPPQL